MIRFRLGINAGHSFFLLAVLTITMPLGGSKAEVPKVAHELLALSEAKLDYVRIIHLTKVIALSTYVPTDMQRCTEPTLSRWKNVLLDSKTGV